MNEHIFLHVHYELEEGEEEDEKCEGREGVVAARNGNVAAEPGIATMVKLRNR